MLLLATVLTFLLAGQSNMVGNGPPRAVPLVVPNVSMLTVDGQWVQAAEPFPQGISDAPYANVGPAGLALPFAARLLRDRRAQAVRLIPCAVNGSPMSEWRSGGALLNACLARVKVKVSGVLFFQGEQDALDAAPAATWAAGFRSFVAAVRTKVGRVPVVYGQLGPTAPAQAADGEPFWNVVKAQQAAVRLPRCLMVKSDDLPVDGVHFTDAGYNTLGARFATAWERVR